MNKPSGKTVGIAVAVGLAVLLLAMMSGFFLYNCFSTLPTKSSPKVVKSDFFNEFKMSIQMEVTNLSYGGHTDYFDVEKSIEEIKDIANSTADKKITYIASVTDGVLFIKGESDKVGYFAIQKLTEIEKRYCISDMAAFIGKSKFILPYQYCRKWADASANEKHYTLQYRFDDGDEIPTDYSFAQWQEFYLGLKRSDCTVNGEKKELVCGSVKLTYTDKNTVIVNLI